MLMACSLCVGAMPEGEWCRACGEGLAETAVTLPPPGFWREVPCGHPPDPVAALSRDGHYVCHCGRILDPADAHSRPPEAPGLVVQCSKCGCHVAVPLVAQTALNEGDGSDVSR